MAETHVVYSEEQLGQLFDEQLRYLGRAGIPWMLIARLRGWRDAVVDRAASMVFHEGHLPFKPVMTDDEISYVYDVAPRCRALPPLPTAEIVPIVSGPIEAVFVEPVAMTVCEPAAVPAVVEAQTYALALFVSKARQAIEAYDRVASGEAPVGTLISVQA